MIYLLSEEGRQALRAIASRPLLYAFDFDGTLAPISADREAVKVPRTVSEWLQELAKRAPCAVVSGRALADLTPRINGTVPYLIGNHGIESPLSPAGTLTNAKKICAGWTRAMNNGPGRLMTALGVDIEDKRYSLTAHYRGAADPDGTCLQALVHLRRLTPPPHLVMGKYSINVLPPGQGGKGPAAWSLVRHLRLSELFYIGDDETDETVFSLSKGLAMGVRVGKQAGSQAQFYLHHQGEVEEMLRFLVHRMDRTPEFPNHGASGNQGAQ